MDEGLVDAAGTATIPVAQGWYARRGKRLLDIAVAVPALLCLAPLLIVLAGLVRLAIGRPVLFRQERIGYRERCFRLLKLRTMTDARGADGRLLPDADRLTGLGRWLRRHSLDELPQLLNIIRGELSLVGPRPLLVRYLPRYTPRQRVRHLARPGLTGWAQVHGRTRVDWGERFEQDIWYVGHCSLRLDLLILLRTAVASFRRQRQGDDARLEAGEFWGIPGQPPGAPDFVPCEETEPPAAPTEPRFRPTGVSRSPEPRARRD